MSEWFQKLLQAHTESIDLVFDDNCPPNIQKNQDQLQVQLGFQAKESVLAQNTPLPTKNNTNSMEISEDNTHDTKKKVSGNHEQKRKTRPPTINEEMGLIAEPPNLQKKKYIKKKKFVGPDMQASQYPTKNFLQNFKGAHLDYLQTKVPASTLQANEIYCRIKHKNGISMQDYRDLYSVVEFQQAFRQMFREKFLYRAMMLSRSCMKSRTDHLGKLSVFEQSFKTKEFDRIN